MGSRVSSAHSPIEFSCAAFFCISQLTEHAPTIVSILPAYAGVPILMRDM
jgi:hypothetical protein